MVGLLSLFLVRGKYTKNDDKTKMVNSITKDIAEEARAQSEPLSMA